MNDFSLDYNTLSFKDPHSCKILNRLIHLACDKTEISTTDKKILVEAIPDNNGCIILLTLMQNKIRKVYKIKKPTTWVAYIFNTTDSLINACVATDSYKIPEENSLYNFEDKYAVIFENIENVPKKFYTLGEFADIIISDKTECAKIKEKGKLLTENAVSVMNRHFR